jgi:hypothetical protein
MRGGRTAGVGGRGIDDARIISSSKIARFGARFDRLAAGGRTAGVGWMLERRGRAEILQELALMAPELVGSPGIGIVREAPHIGTEFDARNSIG